MAVGVENGRTPVTPRLAGSSLSGPVSTRSADPSVGRRLRVHHRTSRETAVALALAAGVVGLAFWVLASSVSLYLPPDGAHYIADADALVGDGVREVRHAPLFPALVAAGQLVLGGVAAFQLAIALSLGALVVAAYLLFRRWVEPGPALLGAATGVLAPTTAELLGWGGGATLIAISMLILALAAMEAWTAHGGARRGLLVGAALGAVALAHPLVFAVGLLCVGARWSALLHSRRRLDRGSGPLGLGGIVAALAALAICLGLAAPFYLELGGATSVSLRVPELGPVLDLTAWAVGGSALVWALLAVSLAALLAVPRSGPLVYLAAVAAVWVALPAALTTDPSYASRATYFMPLVLGAGVALAAAWASERRILAPSWLPRARALGVVLAAGLVVLLAFGTFAPRLERASRYYQALGPEDAQALAALQDRPGAVATTWQGNQYGNGVSMSWFAEALAERPSYGPAAPWLGLLEDQRLAGQAMQQLLAGPVGIENGALQLAAGTPGMRAGPALQVASEGFYHPVLYANTLVNTLPVDVVLEASPTVTGGRITWTFLDRDGVPAMRETVTLADHRAVLSYRLLAPSATGNWSLWLWPAYGVHWRSVITAGSAVEARQQLHAEEIGFRVSAEGAQALYHPTEPRYGLEAIEIRAADSASVTVAIEIDAEAQTRAVGAFDESTILRGYDITDLVLWKDTGWQDRFDRDRCYTRSGQTERLVVYTVDPDRC